MNVYAKPANTIDEHIECLRGRGLSIPDEARVRRYLNSISYFRLSAYARPFYLPGEPEHRFKPDVAFDDIVRLYAFDRSLRLLLLDAIERIEVALRAQITNTLALHHGSHSWSDPSVFDDRYEHAWLMETIRKKLDERNPETFLAHYREKYDHPKEPPVWMVMEVLSFKEVSVLFSKLKHAADKQVISAHFGFPDRLLQSWFRALSDLRNICAHHGRVWNREFGSRPMMPKSLPKDWPDLSRPVVAEGIAHQPESHLAMMLVVIETLLRRVNPGSKWRHRFKVLLDKHPDVPTAPMALEPDWHRHPFWRMEEGA